MAHSGEASAAPIICTPHRLFAGIDALACRGTSVCHRFGMVPRPFVTAVRRLVAAVARVFVRRLDEVPLALFTLYLRSLRGFLTWSFPSSFAACAWT